MEWSIGGLRPDMHRDLVLAHCGSPVRILDEDLWDYLDFAVVFRNHRVVQVVGRRLELHGKQFFDVADPLGDTQAWKALEAMTENRNGHNGIFVSDCLLAHREVPLNSTCGAAPSSSACCPHEVPHGFRSEGCYCALVSRNTWGRCLGVI